jgi:hypothetical protein
MAEPDPPVSSQPSSAETLSNEERLSTREQQLLRADLSTTSWILIVLVFGGFVVTAAETWGHEFAALVWAFACIAVGSIAGFLFAIPRVPRTPSKTESAGASAGIPTASQVVSDRGFGLGINTNLEEISDWLTKILVGVGLIQLRSLPSYVRRAGEYVGRGLGPGLETVASGIVIYFLGLGFLCGYLMTRMFLGPAFRLADQATRSGLAAELKETRAIAEAAKAVSQAAKADSQLAKEKGTVDSDVQTAMEELNKPDHPPARMDQLIEILRGYLRDNPLHRKLNIVLGRLYAEGKRDLDGAIDVLQKFIAKKTQENQANDRDTADAFFNIACYYSKKMEETQEEIRKEFEEKGIAAIRNSLEILPQNAADVLVDNDLSELRRSESVKQLVETTLKKLSNSNS